MLLNYFFYLGTMSLFFLMLEERKIFKFGLGDDKKNYIMLGVALSLLSHMPQGIGYIFFISIYSILIILGFKFQGMSKLGMGALFWITFGLSIYGIIYSLLFLGICQIFLLLAFGLKRAFKAEKEIPFLFVVINSFILFSFLFGFY